MNDEFSILPDCTTNLSELATLRVNGMYKNEEA